MPPEWWVSGYRLPVAGLPEILPVHQKVAAHSMYPAK